MHRAMVTGGTRGVGFAVASALLRIGGKVMITGVDAARVDHARQALESAAGDPSRVAAAVADVRDRAAVEAALASAVQQFGGLDVLVNNAGIGLFAEVASMSDTDWSRVIDTNLTGPFQCARAAIPELRRSGGGWIINVASLAGAHPFPRGAAYCASKAALIAFSESLMQEVRFENIRVSVVLPGSIATEFNGRSVTSEDEGWKLSPDDVADAVVNIVQHDGRSLPSRVEIRPSRPRRG